MEGTDLSGYNYPNFLQDYTYYGNGCPNDWGDGGDGGSQQSCTTRITQTADHEDMKNGTYYNRNGATAGSTLTTAGNTDAPDTFCPLGWQMPYGGTAGDYYNKSKSARYLFETAYSYGDGSGKGTNAMSYPFSYNFDGLINGNNHGSVRLYYMKYNSSANFWSKTYSTVYSLGLANIYYAQNHGPIDGRAVRCNLLILFLHRRHGGRNGYTFSRFRLYS